MRILWYESPSFLLWLYLSLIISIKDEGNWWRIPKHVKVVQEKRLAEEIGAIEKDTGFKLRVLAQNYPDTPGISIDV